MAEGVKVGEERRDGNAQIVFVYVVMNGGDARIMGCFCFNLEVVKEGRGGGASRRNVEGTIALLALSKKGRFM